MAPSYFVILCHSETKHAPRRFDPVIWLAHFPSVKGVLFITNSVRYSQSVWQEGRRQRANGDLKEDSVGLHQIPSPDRELGAVWERKHSERWKVVSALTGTEKDDFLRFEPQLTFIPLCWMAVQPVSQTDTYRYLVLRWWSRSRAPTSLNLMYYIK